MSPHAPVGGYALGFALLLVKKYFIAFFVNYSNPVFFFLLNRVQLLYDIFGNPYS
jgi:hypothetical protein